MFKKAQRKSSWVLAICSMVFVSGSLAAVAEEGDSKPANILFILTDDQGWSQMSGAVHPDFPETASKYLNTPHMDSLAKAGMRFTSGYAPAPLCTPTRRSVLCGTSAVRSGTEFTSPWVPAKHMTIPKALKQANPAYQCAHFGKWGEEMISSPEECGYDVSDGHTGNDTGGMAGRGKPFNLKEDPKRTGTVTERTKEFMRKQSEAGKPFYAQVSYYAVHLSVELHEDSLKHYQEKGEPDRRYTPGFAGMLDELDQGIGALLASLEELGIADNTYVFFMSDNGGRGSIPTGDKELPPTNFPLSGAKHSLEEGGIRVPFFVRGPGVGAGSVCHQAVSGYDLLPTFYELAGGEKALEGEVDGGSFASLLTKPEEGSVERPFEALVFHRPRKGMSAIRQGDHKLLLRWTKQGEVRSTALFEVQSDPQEKKNLAKEDTQKAEALQKLLLDYLEENAID